MSEIEQRQVERMGASQGSVEAEEAPSVSVEELALIEERVREHEADPNDVVPWGLAVILIPARP